MPTDIHEQRCGGLPIRQLRRIVWAISCTDFLMASQSRFRTIHHRPNAIALGLGPAPIAHYRNEDEVGLGIIGVGFSASPLARDLAGIADP